MIFVTVGGQMPFDRLVLAIDQWASRAPGRDVVAQIGPGAQKPRHMTWVEFLPPASHREHIERAELVIAHAGMGTIINCLELATPLVILPRRAQHGETRNDHQVATAQRFRQQGSILVCDDEIDLIGRLEAPIPDEGSTRLGPFASDALLARIAGFINQEKR